MKIIKQITASLLLSIFAITTLTACGDDDNTNSTPVLVDGEAAISFSAGVAGSEAETRVYTSTIDNVAKLQQVVDGFGVFAYLNDATPWATAKTSTIADFMYNQSVYWGISYITQDGSGNDVEHNDWVYNPPKYWPNYTDNDNANPRYVSFFAYAPFTPEGATAGITAFPNKTDKTQPFVEYTIAPPGEQPDLLWANFIDARRNGEGLIETATDPNTYQKVPLTFHHALACVDVYIQRIFDEETFEGKVPTKADTTKLFVSELKLQETSKTPKSIYYRGDLSLETGTWSNLTGKTGTDADQTLTYGERYFSANISGTSNMASTDLEKAIVRDAELDKWEKKGTGVDGSEQPLFAAHSLMLLPQADLKVTPTLTYSMVTRDNTLQHNYLEDTKGNRYSRILNTVKGGDFTLTLEQGKRYKLLIHVGVETVQFELVSVEDWDFPIRFNTEVDEYEQQTIEKTVHES